MRTMPSDTPVNVPSLRASAVSLNFSMRLLMSSEISDGLSVVAIFLFPRSCAARAAHGFLWWESGVENGESSKPVLSLVPISYSQFSIPYRSVRQRRLKLMQPATHRSIDDDITG